MESITITSFPFKGRTLKEIISAGKKYEILEINHGHSYEILMNQDIIDVEESEKHLMAFIKFIEEEILICAKDCDMENISQEQESEITNFISLILNRIVKMISTLSKNGERPKPVDVRSCLGQKVRYGDIYLYDIIELIMNSQGLMHKPGTIGEIQKIDFVQDDLNDAIEEKLNELNGEPNVRMHLHTHSE